MRHLYTFIYYLSLPLTFIRLFWRGRKTPAYAQRIKERFGYIPTAKPNGIWIHTVSLGEFIAATPLIRQLLDTQPLPITVTTTTPTGSERVQHVFHDRVFHVYFPYDISSAITRFLNRVRPRIAIMMETELWPNLFHICHQRNIPVLIANARLSAQSARNYQCFHFITRPMLQNITLIAAQTRATAKRFIALGLPKSRVTIMGNVKFDIKIPDDLLQKAAALREQCGGTQRQVWIAASTHPGEEEIILEAFKEIKALIPTVLLILVPRHPERFTSVTQLCRHQGWKIVLRSEQRSCDHNSDIFIGDSVGELLLFYAAADVAFVGGSLVPVGGHNILEPAAVGIPSITGPHMFNFTEIQHILCNGGITFALTDSDANSLVINTLKLLQDTELRNAVREKAENIFDKNQGAVERLMKIINQQLISHPKEN